MLTQMGTHGNDAGSAADTDEQPPDTKPPRQLESDRKRVAAEVHLVIAYSSQINWTGRVVAIPKVGRIVFGRDGDVRVPDAAVSRVHVEVRRTSQNEVVVVDLNSRNGLFLNRRRVAQASVNVDDVIRIGDTMLVMGGDGNDYDPTTIATRYGPGKLPLILQGETGTGKEVLARKIHDMSGRPGKFVAIDCTNLPATLVEAELFGHTRGAFSGATSRDGLFSFADHGTVLLDEILDLEPEMQGKLLRVLESGTIRPLGGNQEIPVDVRVLAAGGEDLAAAVTAGRFRRDLYARLAGRTITLPGLRQRRASIIRLLQEIAAESEYELTPTPDAAELILTYTWPENVRELKMLVRRTLEETTQRNSRHAILRVDHLPAKLQQETLSESASQTRLVSAAPCTRRRERRVSREELIAALRETNGNVSRAARLLRRRRELVHRWIKLEGLKPAG